MVLMHSIPSLAEFREHLSRFSWPNAIPISFSTPIPTPTPTPILSAFFVSFFPPTGQISGRRSRTEHLLVLLFMGEPQRLRSDPPAFPV
jgi:hypothetical protein